MKVSYKDIVLKASYESGVDDLVQDFYVPVLDQSVSYDRIAGFFSSSSLSIAARGIAGLIKNNGKMRLITSPKFSQEDAKILMDLREQEKVFFEDILLLGLNDIESSFEKDHLEALGWMLSNGYLEMKIAYLIDGSDDVLSNYIFHQKIGILKDDEGNKLSFSGSINETASGWTKNIEEFKVFKEWSQGEKPFYDADEMRFRNLWEGKRTNVKIIDLPQAIKNKLIEYSTDFSVENFIAKSYIKSRKSSLIEEKLSLFEYQQKAVNMWESNNYQLLFEMATGTGKTRTALACMNKAITREKKIVVVVSCPQTTLSKQWKDNEIKPAGFRFDEELIADSTNNNWRTMFNSILSKISIGYYKSAIIYTTHMTSCSKDFIEYILQSDLEIEFCFIGDEVHGLGAPKSKAALLNRYKYRIGLSATPKRWFDDYGTSIISEFFGNKSFQFSIADALTTINPLTNKPFLIDYYYYPVFVCLTEEELEEYRKLSNRIRRLSSYSETSDEYQKLYEKLLFARANIQKNAYMKYSILNKILLSIEKVENTLIFVSDVQIDEVMRQLRELRIIAHRFTQKQGTVPRKQFGGISEREYLIENFKKGNYKALVAISCLDEGIDIPSADTAILMSNSTNPREYVQRIGRVIRQMKDKRIAYIYDFIVEPNWNIYLPIEMKKFEREIFEKELMRANDMSLNAINNAGVRKILDDKLWEVEKYGIE